MAGTFIGRDRELAELTAGLRSAFDGRGGVFVVSGEPGIGKTELADRLASDARERGAQVALGRCWEGDGAPPFWPWAQIVRSLAAELDDDALRAFAGSGAAQIALLAPDLAPRLGVATDVAHATDSEAGRFYLLEAVGRFLREASRVRPILLVLDDLQDADRPSHHLLRFLAQDVRTSRILIVATYREVAGTQPPEDVDVMVDLVRDGQVLTLRGLDRREVERLIEETSGVAPWNGRAAAIHEATRGNPLFVREVTRLLAARGLLDRPGRLEIPLPQSVRAVIRQRLSPLSADTVRVLSAAAVVGRTFQIGLVVAASDLPMERVLATLSEATTMGVVSPAADSVGMYDFAHPLVRDVIYDELPVPARMQLHQRVGEAIEDRHGPNARLYLSELAYHFGKVAPAGHGRKARDYATDAGTQAMEAGAYEDAIVEYGRALEAHAFTDLDERVRCDLLLRLGDAQAKTGDYESSKATFLSAAESARKLADPERLAQAALGFGEPQVESGVVDRQLLSLLQEAVAGLGPGQDALRVRLLARHSLELTFSDEAETREALSLEAVEIARRLGEPGPLASALRARWMAAWGPDGLEERVDMAEEVLRLAVETGDRETELVGRARRVTCAVELGDLLAAEAEIAVHAELAGELRMPYHVWTAVSMRAMRALLQERLGTAEGLAQQALDVLPGKLNAVYAHLNQVTAIRWDEGRLAELRDTWAGVVETFPQAGFARGWLCLADLELGMEDEARRGLRALTDSVFTQPRDGIWPAALALSAVAAAELDDPDAAAAVLPLLGPYGEQTLVIPMPHPVTCFGSAWLYVALLETALERWDEADEHFGDAARANGRMGARSLLARTQHEHARMLLRRNEG
ncbi:MAG TPA: AAA family ATPase, partial [Actinomycetota bacterium]|nr:AAA family ATPase [Actinomycetota bacterium]